MRFCLVSTQKHWGGGEALLWSIGEELRQAGHAISWIVRNHSEVESRVAQEDSLVLHRLSGRGTNLRDWFATRRVLRNWVPDTLILNDTHAVPLVGSAAYFCRVPRPLRLAYKHTIFPLRSSLKYRLLTDKLICVSKAARTTVTQGGLTEKHSVVVHGGCRSPSISAEGCDAIRSELGISQGQRLIVCVGSLLDCKGHADWIAAAADLATTHPHWITVIAGEGVERANLENQIANLGLNNHVRLLGYRNDAEQLLASADLVVHPSHAEGLSLVLIQAQMLGKPVVATAVGGAAEVLQANSEDRCTGWIANAQSPTSLAEQARLALTEIETNPAELSARLETTARQTRENFDIAKNTQQLVETCGELMQARLDSTA